MPEPSTKTPFPTPFQRKTLWAAITGISMVIIGCIAVGLIVLGARILQFLQPVLVPLAAAGIVAYLLDPLIGKLMKRGVPRKRAMLVVFSSFLALILVMMLSVVPAAIEQGVDLLQRRAAITEKAGNWIESGLFRVEKWVMPLMPAREAGTLPAGADYRLQIVNDKAELPDKGENLVAIAFSAEEIHIRRFDEAGTQADATEESLSTKPSQLNELWALLQKQGEANGSPANGVDGANGANGVDGVDGVDGPAAPADDGAGQAQAIIASAIGLFDDSQTHWLKAQIKDWLLKHYPSLLAKLWNFISSGLQGFLGVFGYIFGLFLVPIYLFYFLKESASIQENWSNYLPLQQSQFKDEVVGTLTEINGYLISFFRGQMLVSMIDGALIGICLTFIGMPNGLLVGVFVALLGLIPYLGNVLCWVPAMLISIAHFGAVNPRTGELVNTWSWMPEGAIWPYPLVVTGIFVIVQQINGLVTAPKIVGDSVGLHPLTVIFSVFFWSLLIGGLLGALLAVPLTAALKVLFQRYVWERGKDYWEQRRVTATGNAA